MDSQTRLVKLHQWGLEIAATLFKHSSDIAAKQVRYVLLSQAMNGNVKYKRVGNDIVFTRIVTTLEGAVIQFPVTLTLTTEEAKVLTK